MVIETFFSNLASRGPLLMSGTDVYFLTSNPAGHYLEFRDGTKLGLVPAGNLADLIRYNSLIRAEEIFSFKKRFIEEKVEQNFQTAEEMRENINTRELFSFIVKELMPFMSGHKEDLAYLLGEEIKKQNIEETKEVDEKDVLAALEEVKGKLRQEQGTYAKENFNEKDKGGYFKSLFKGYNILTLENTVYLLEKTRQPDLTLVLNGKTEDFCLGKWGTVAAAEEKYAMFTEWQARMQAIDEFSDYLKEKQRTKLAAAKNFDQIIKLKEFNEGDIGFLQTGGIVYVYHIIPPFAMLDPRPTYEGYCYEFPRLRVGLPIKFSDRRIHLSEPILFEPVWHPFVDRDKTPFQHICGGDVPLMNHETEVEWAAKALDDAKNILMHGLTPASIRQHGGDRTAGGNYFEIPLDTKLAPRKIKVEEARKKGLLITNKHKWDR